METHVQMDEIVDDKVTEQNFDRIGQSARDVIWKLLFNSSENTTEAQKKAEELLDKYKSDACFYAPWPYNEWIIKLRDEVLKENLLDFWKDGIVKKQLGPCWSGDSDLFDADDLPPTEFYAKAGCVAPFADSLGRASSATAANAEDFVIGLEQPLKDYQKLIETRVQMDEIVDDAITQGNFERIAQAARDVVWKLLFNTEENKPEAQSKAEELMEEYRTDACFYAPWPYNEWIVKLRDELLKENILDFWKDSIVKKQLGPCWSRDSDLFDADDTPPVEFYAKAGCVAPFAASLRVRGEVHDEEGHENAEDEEMANEEDNLAASTGNFEVSISKETPLADYRDLMKRFVLTKIIVPDDIHESNVNKIAKGTQEIIWQLLFENPMLSQEDMDKISELLQEYRSDASFYGPWSYNEWIVKLRDEILEKQLIEFWRDKIVEFELGPICNRDSDFFDDDDPLPLAYYDKAGCKAPFDPSAENDLN
ncbi:uncharacterized protein EndoGI [Drosophila tropicalis]|uniref:uncharacterized protein EndoGI n=1 Tax=Drosophila tropicalis TaxID=46794 RepID=UPI0035ABF792